MTGGARHDLLDGDRALVLVGATCDLPELLVDRHDVTPSPARSFAIPRSPWVCTVLFDTPRSSAISANDHS